MSCALTKCALLKEHSRRKRNGLSKLWEKTYLNCVAHNRANAISLKHNCNQLEVKVMETLTLMKK